MGSVDVKIEQGAESDTLVSAFTYIPDVVFHNADSKVSPEASATATVDAPSNLSDGDLVILVRHDSNANSAAAPAGFTEIVDAFNPGGGNVGRVVAWYRIASSEPASYDVTLKNWGYASAHRVTGFNPANPIADSQGAFNTSDTTSLAIPEITAPNGAALVSVLAGRLDHGGGLSIDGSMSIVVDRSNFGFAGAAFDSGLSSGATGTRTWTWTTARRAAAALFAINPG